MQKEILMRPIGRVRHTEQGVKLVLDKEMAEGLKGLSGFSHVLVLWHCHLALPQDVSLTVQKPYRQAPGTLGLFATRSPLRPNPLALSVAGVLAVDETKGEIAIDWTDADDGSPILDVKPYTPSLDRVENPNVPPWCAHWPQSTEASAAFDWEAEMVF